MGLPNFRKTTKRLSGILGRVVYMLSGGDVYENGCDMWNSPPSTVDITKLAYITSPTPVLCRVSPPYIKYLAFKVAPSLEQLITPLQLHHWCR